MKKLALTVCMVFILFAGNAYALWIDVYDPTNVLLNSGNTSYQYTHDITDNGFDVGFENVWAFNLLVDLNNESGNEASVDIRGDGEGRYDYNFWVENLGIWVWGDATLNETGMLTVNIYRNEGSFYFAKSTLTALGNDVAVPEPTTMLLLGLGLVGIAAVRRRK